MKTRIGKIFGIGLQIVAHNRMVTTVQLIAYDREERKIYYADAKW